MTNEAISLLVNPSEVDVGALSDWRWLLVGSFRPLAMTRFGDWFIERPGGDVEFLDTLEGGLRPVASSVEAWRALLHTAEGRELLMAEMVELMASKGVVPGPGECYGFRVAPILGGGLGSENVQIYSLPVYLAIQGQLHRQLQANKG